VREIETDLAILGGGPGGYVAAIRATQLGMRVALIEREAIGGVCLNHGCIPAKSLLRSAEVLDLVRRASEFGVEVEGVHARFDAAVKRSGEVVRKVVSGVEYLLERHGVAVLRGEGRFVRPHELLVEPSGDRVRASHVILATGARPFSPWPVDGHRVMTSREALWRPDLPPRVIVVGGGCVGVEFAEVYSSFGAEVTLVERNASLLPDFDRDVSDLLRRALEARGIAVYCGAEVREVLANAEGVKAVLDGHGSHTIEADALLVGLGIRPNTENLGLQEVAVLRDERGFVVTDERGATSAPGVYAVGDVTGRLPLAHVAFAQGTIAAEAIAGMGSRALDLDAVPRAVYTDPQVASVGLSEDAARSAGRDIVVGRFSSAASGAAVVRGSGAGLVKLVIDRASGGILGSHLAGESATELVHEIALGRLLETTPAELVATVHAHPTLAESIREAALDATTGAIHFYRSASGG